MLSDPTSQQGDKKTFQDRRNLGTAAIPSSSHIKVSERRDIKVRGARYEPSAVILTL